MDKATEQFVEWLKGQVAYSQKEIASFAKALPNGAWVALTGCERMFEHAAWMQHAGACAAWIVKGTMDLRTVAARAQREVNQGARYPKFSTAGTSVLMSRYDGAVWAEIAEHAQTYLEAAATEAA